MAGKSPTDPDVGMDTDTELLDVAAMEPLHDITERQPFVDRLRTMWASLCEGGRSAAKAAKAGATALWMWLSFKAVLRTIAVQLAVDVILGLYGRSTLSRWGWTVLCDTLADSSVHHAWRWVVATSAAVTRPCISVLTWPVHGSAVGQWVWQWVVYLTQQVLYVLLFVLWVVSRPFAWVGSAVGAVFRVASAVAFFLSLCATAVVAVVLPGVHVDTVYRVVSALWLASSLVKLLQGSRTLHPVFVFGFGFGLERSLAYANTHPFHPFHPGFTWWWTASSQISRCGTAASAPSRQGLGLCSRRGCRGSSLTSAPCTTARPWSSARTPCSPRTAAMTCSCAA